MLFKINTTTMIIGAVAIYFLFFRKGAPAGGIILHKEMAEPTNYGK